MVDIIIVVAICIASLLSFLDFIVFNEEILLALCFISFLFYCFNTLSDTIFQGFESRAAKFEQDLLSSFDGSKQAIISEFDNNSKSIQFVGQFTILLTCLSHLIEQCLAFMGYKPNWYYFQISLTKLNELVVSNLELVEQLNKSYVIRLLYSLLLNKAQNNLVLISPALNQPKSGELKNLSVLN
jgi:hypothetical protein